jgi:RNA polymerase sigma-70 factor (ECF subfamily)
MDRVGEADAPPDLERQLAQLVESARAAWPSLSVPTPDFLRYVADRVRGRPLAASLKDLHAGDLLLSFGCARGDAHAIGLFEETLFKDLDMILARLTTNADVIQELPQTLRTKLFVGDKGGPPKIADYAGRGDLRGWFRITATRHAISALRKPRREVSTDDELILLVPETAIDPELRYLRELYGDQFQRAFKEAVAALSTQERNLLRYHYIDRLSIDEIGGIYRIHRVTAARRITKVREALIEAFRRLLRERLRVGTQELESILRLVQSQLQVSLARVLGPHSIGKSSRRQSTSQKK